MTRTACSLLGVLLLIAGCATLPPSQAVDSAAGHHSYVVAGDGAPTIVLEAGLGDGKETWKPVFDALGAGHRVFAYDRAGYGSSRSSGATRDARTIVAELRSALHSAGITPPYLLVGHSLGGTYVEYFARQFPDEVSGVVLVDSRQVDFEMICEAHGAPLCQPPGLLKALSAELTAAEATRQQVMASPPFPPVPLAVLTGAKLSLAGSRFRDAWLESQTRLLELSPTSRQFVCKRCGHYVHRDDPERVLEAVQWVVDRLPPGQQRQPPG